MSMVKCRQLEQSPALLPTAWEANYSTSLCLLFHVENMNTISNSKDNHEKFCLFLVICLLPKVDLGGVGLQYVLSTSNDLQTMTSA